MFGFIRRLFGTRRPPDGSMFRVRLRDGSERRYDPLVLRRKLNAALPDWAEKVDDIAKSARPLPKLGSADDQQKWEGRRTARVDGLMAEVAAAVSAAFELPPLAPDGSGFTEQERVEVLGSFLAYCARVLEDTRPLASGGEPTGSPESAAPSPQPSGSD